MNLPRRASSLNEKQVFQKAWCRFVDEELSDWVKSRFAPNDKWKDRPFSKEDLRFFGEPIIELSEILTTIRGKTGKSRPMAYFSQPRFRSAYLLYFLPLQAAKFLALFSAQNDAMATLLQEGKKEGVIRVQELGAGPGTGSLALFFWWMKNGTGDKTPIQFYWSDQNRKIMEDGRDLLLQVAKNFSLEKNIEIFISDHPKSVQPHFTIAGHLLNEMNMAQIQDQRFLESLFSCKKGAGILILEPALPSVSKVLSEMRNFILEEGVASKSMWGPCLHDGVCPLTNNKDWCHFSTPAELPGKWFSLFSKQLGSIREWLKFSYLWFAAPESIGPPEVLSEKRVISDPFKDQKLGKAAIICEPENPKKIKVYAEDKIGRGQVISSSRKPPENRPPKGTLKVTRKKTSQQKKKAPRRK